MIKGKLYEIYGNNYELIDSYYSANTGGEKGIDGIIKVDDIYSVFQYRSFKATGATSFYGNHNSIKKGNEYLDKNNILDIKNISVLSIYDLIIGKEKNEGIELRIIINKNDYKIDELSEKIQGLINELGSKYYRVNINLYVAKEIQDSNLSNYKLFLTLQLSEKDEEFYNKYNKKLVYKDICANFTTNKYNENNYWYIEKIKEELNNNKI